MKFKVNQMDLVLKIMHEIDEQAKERGIKTLACTPRQTQAMINAANSIVAAMDSEDRLSAPGMGARAWLASDDTGLSSKCMCRVLFGLGDGENDFPRDSSDFGRCYRFLQAVTHGALPANWRSQMAAVSKEWAALIPKWDRLTELYEAKDGKTLYAEIVALTRPIPS